MAKRGVLFIVSAPSGAGKTTLVRGLLERDPQIGLSVSHTTRAARPGEVDGVAYHFVSTDAFSAMRAAGDFIESAHVHGNYYGTSRRWLEERLNAGHDVLLEIDWQGAQQLYQIAGGDVVRVFILPPSMEELHQRLLKRATDSTEIIDRRMSSAANEVSHWDGYDYVLVNDDVEECFQQVRTILSAERLKRSRQTGLIGFIRKLRRAG